MAKALKGVKELPFEPPQGIVTQSITDPDGKTTSEFYYSENVGNGPEGPSSLREINKPSEEVKNQIF
jgi:penicillin-binding protein 1A